MSVAAKALWLGAAVRGASAVTCAQDGSDYSYTESVSGNARTITTNHCPNHPNYNLNPNFAVNQERTYSVPASPTFNGAATDSSIASAGIDLTAKGGEVGVLFNGAMLFSPYGGPMYGTVTGWETGATYAEGNTFDQCGGHASSTSAPSYHIHVPPSCLLRQLGQTDTEHSPQVGWAFDGFPTYGPRGPGGTMMQTCSETGGTYGTDVCTDDCGGYYRADGTIDEFVYRYYILGQYNDGTSCDLPGCASPTREYHPNTPVCYRGCCPAGQTCHQSISACPNSGTSDGVTSDYAAAAPTVNGLSVASGLPTNDGGCSCDQLACSQGTCSEQDWSRQTCGAGQSNNWVNECPAGGAAPSPSGGAAPSPAGGDDLVPLEYAQVHHASDGVYDMTIGDTTLTKDGAYGLTTRGFTNGVTFRMAPGDSLQVKIINNMLTANNKDCDETAGEFCEATITNLHTHGLHVSSRGVTDGLEFDSDNVFAEVMPQTEKNFKFTIPDYHMGGTHWYHPHHHHATALQAGGGAAGVIIVEDEPGYLPTEFSNMEEHILFISGHNLQTLQTIARSAEVTGWLEDAVAQATRMGVDTNMFLVNGQLGPAMTVMAHDWNRLRMVYAAVEQTLSLTVTGDATCTLGLLAKDGVYLPEIPRTISEIHLYPGARSDVAMSCTCVTYPCSGTLASTDGNRRLQGGGGRRPGQGGPAPDAPGLDAANVDVLTFVIEENAGATTVALPTTVLERPCYLADLTNADVLAGNSNAIALNGGGRTVTWNGVGQSMTHANVAAVGGKENWPAIGSVSVGTVQEFVVTGAQAHPLHLHINPFQIISMGGQDSLSDGYFQTGDWHDTLYLEEMQGGTTLTIRMNTDVFTGRMVVHCHILEHEDEGMMGWIDITGDEGATYEEAAVLQPGCYTSALGMSPSPSGGMSPSPSGGMAPSPSGGMSPSPEMAPSPSGGMAPSPSGGMAPSPSGGMSPSPEMTPSPSGGMAPSPSGGMSPSPWMTPSPSGFSPSPGGCVSIPKSVAERWNAKRCV